MGEEQKKVTTGSTLQARMAEIQNNPGRPPSAQRLPPSAPVPPPSQTATPQPEGIKPALKTRGSHKKKDLVRATHFVDEDGISWIRTGVTLPLAFLNGLNTYVYAAKMQWAIGEAHITQQELIIDAIARWLNDHRDRLTESVNRECDEVRRELGL